MEDIIEPSLDRLLQELNSFKNLNNPRLTILGLQLYSEHYVNEILMEQLNETMKEEIRKYLPFPKKLKILKKMNFIDKKKKEILFSLNSLRDIIVHELVFSKKKLNKELEDKTLSFQYSWVLKEKSGKFVKSQNINLEDPYKNKIKDKFTQLIISAILIIGLLHHSLMKLKNKPCTELIEINFKERVKGVWEAIIFVNKLPPSIH